MRNDLWRDVDRYFNRHLMPDDPVMDAVLQASEDAGLPQIAVAPNQGKLLMLLARSVGARRIWRSAHWVATPPFGWRGRCPMTGA
jgi:predicted O-methyltransferase YrrM